MLTSLAEKPFLWAMGFGMIVAVFRFGFVGALLAAPFGYWMYRQYSHYDG